MNRTLIVAALATLSLVACSKEEPKAPVTPPPAAAPVAPAPTPATDAAPAPTTTPAAPAAPADAGKDTAKK